MALRGVRQLKKLVVSYSDWGGSSRGIRSFMESHLPAFKEKNPQLEVVNEHICGQHPHLKGLYNNQMKGWCVCEEYGSRRSSSMCNQAKEFTGKESGETED